MFDVHAALRSLVDLGGSDLHIKVPAQPLIRVDGELQPLEGAPRLTPQDTESALDTLLDNPDKRAEFDAEQEVDFSFAIPGIARYRVNAFRQRGSISLVCRAIPFGIKTIDELDLPEILKEMALEERGIVL